MRGRYYRQSDKQKIAETFLVARWAPDVHLVPDYNIAPSTFQPILRSSPEDGEREVVLMRWGLIPAKAADPDAFKNLFNHQRTRRDDPQEVDLEGPIPTQSLLGSPRRFLRMVATTGPPTTAAHRTWRAWAVRRHSDSNQAAGKAQSWFETCLQVRDAGRRTVCAGGIVFRMAAGARRFSPCARYLFNCDD
jgi:hypothetical protein